jgi:hypothetical protein
MDPLDPDPQHCFESLINSKDPDAGGHLVMDQLDPDPQPVLRIRDPVPF